MEIRKYLKDILLNSAFKIDLIVWKYLNESVMIFQSQLFKIDLIVWKLLNKLLE